MVTKRNAKDLTKVKSEINFAVKRSDGATFIEGFANKNVIDRGNEIINPDAWDLENFSKNPVILFNHGMDPVFGGTPVGMATQVKPTEEGLFIKVRLSGSKSPLLSMVRDLVNEGILKTFSVGFEPKQTDMKQIDDKEIRVIEKAELFEVSIVGIPMNQDSTFEVTGKMLKTKSLDQLGEFVCEKKGAFVAGAVHHQMTTLLTAGDFDRDEALNAVAEKAEVERADLKDILSGDITPVPEDVLKAFAEVLSLDFEDLQKLDAGDLELSQFIQKDAETKEEEKTDDEESMSNTTKADDDCVSGKIPKLLDEGLSQEQAVARAIAMCEDEGKCMTPPTADQFKEYLALADSLVESKQAGEGTEDDPGPTTQIQLDKTVEEFGGNPYLEQSKQTNVLLGTMISKFDSLIDALTGIVNNRNTESLETTDDKNEDVDQAMIDKYRKHIENLKQRVEKLS